VGTPHALLLWQKKSTLTKAAYQVTSDHTGEHVFNDVEKPYACVAGKVRVNDEKKSKTYTEIWTTPKSLMYDKDG
jgi:ATP sulfurylase